MQSPENPYTAPEADSTVPTMTSERIIPNIPIVLDPTWCFSRAWNLVTKNFGKAFVLITLPAIISAIINSILSQIAMFIDGTRIEAVDFFGEQIQMQQQIIGAGTIVANIVGTIVGAFFTIGIIHVSLKFIDNQNPEFGDIFTQAKKLIRGVLATWLFSIAVTIGILLLIFPGIYLMCRFGFFYHAIVDKDLGIIDAFKYSLRLTNSSTLNVFLLGVFMFGAYLAGILLCCIGLLWALPLVVFSTTVAYAYMHQGTNCIAFKQENA